MNSADLRGIAIGTKDGCTTMQSARHVPASLLRNMFENDHLHDVTLCGVPPAGVRPVSLRPIRAFKVVLAHASSHLHDLFTVDGYIDSHQSHYDIKNVDHESLRRIVEFVHTDKMTVDEECAVDAVCGVLVGAKYLVMENGLADACENFLAEDEQVKLDNCVKQWCFARKYSCLTLMEVVAKFIVEHLNDMPESDAFLNMPYADCAKLLLSEAFVVADADARCRAAFAWLSHSSEESRADHVHDVLNMVPFTSGELSIGTMLQANEYQVLRERAPDLFNLAMVNTLKKVQKDHPTTGTVASNGFCSASYSTWYVMGNSVDDEELHFLQYDVGGRLWSTLPTLPWKRTQFAACGFNNRLVVMGGRKNGWVTADIDEYDVANSLWSTSDVRLTKARYKSSTCANNRNVYAVGGWASCFGAVNVVERCGTTGQLGRPVELASSLEDRYECTASFATAHNAVFVAGGRSSTKIEISSIEKYDIEAGTWTQAGNLTQRRGGLASVFAGSEDELYLIGGSEDDALNTVEIFNVRTGQIRAAPALLHSRAVCRAVAMEQGNVIAVLGACGFARYADSRAVETYDVREGKWAAGVIVPDMPLECSDFFECVAI